ncbi:MAG TPA: alkaline phosphatase family protein [Propionibacteriaceae bacterium]|nr:alkaline phosphatase family protein [Propionibacteriaceae bacterium]
MTSPVIPAYGVNTLADLLPSVGAHLGIGSSDVLGLPESQRYVVLLIDGLGTEQLARHSELAPYLSSLNGPSLTCGVPSTTATSITSFGTGLAPGAHGVAGYSFWYPPLGEVLNALRWASGLYGIDVQPQLTSFERFAKAGIGTATVAPAAFAATGLTELALRDPNFLGVSSEGDLDERTELVNTAAAIGGRNLTYCYERLLDKTGHPEGVDSSAWRDALAWVDRLARVLRERLPDDVRLLITADHGMVDVTEDSRVIIDDEAELMADVTAVAGEARFRHLMTAPETGQQVAERWRRRLGDRAWVLTRSEAIEAGWFGPLAPRFADRFGDVVVAMSDDGAILSRKFPGEFRLIGMHGSLSTAEMTVPLLID